MSTPPDHESRRLLALVNKSGFPFQLGLESLVRRKQGAEHQWKVLYKEHSWRTEDGRDSGYIDLVLENENQTMVLVIECKRHQSTDFVFLKPASQLQNDGSTGRTKAFVSHARSESHKLTCLGWHDIDVRPETFDVPYCVLSSDQRQRHLLESVAAELIDSTEALAMEESRLSALVPQFTSRVYISAIVTTASLMLCRLDTDAVDMVDGNAPQGMFEVASWLRFRKQFSTGRLVPKSVKPPALSGWKEHSVFVISSKSFLDFLKLASFNGTSLRDIVPM